MLSQVKEQWKRSRSESKWPGQFHTCLQVESRALARDMRIFPSFQEVLDDASCPQTLILSEGIR